MEKNKNKYKYIFVIILMLILFTPYFVQALGVSDIDKMNTDKVIKTDLFSISNNQMILSGGILDCKNKAVITDTVRYYWKYVIILAPILLLVMCTVDFMKAVMSGDNDALQKSGTNALKRVIAMIVLLLVPTILSIVFTWFGIEQALCF